jgi:hypothetical protein
MPSVAGKPPEKAGGGGGRGHIARYTSEVNFVSISMSQTMAVFILLFVLAFGVLAALRLFVRSLDTTPSPQPRVKTKGEWVAEVWLEWPICRGSTMYRQRFRFRWMAYLAVRFHAFLLDAHLPTHYRDTDWSGNPCLYRYDYGIYYGVRKLAASECERFHPFWSVDLPGSKEYHGEHASAHPLQGAGLRGSTAGFRV